MSGSNSSLSLFNVTEIDNDSSLVSNFDLKLDISIFKRIRKDIDEFLMKNKQDL